MKSKENIVFLGMMGSGKTSIGKLISKELKLNFFDVDECIEKKFGIFGNDGLGKEFDWLNSIKKIKIEFFRY